MTILKHVIMIWIALICLDMVNSQAIRPGSTCTGSMIGGTGFQYCVTLLGNVDSNTSLTDRCSYYSESINCAKRDVDSRGGHCTLDDIEYLVKMMGLATPSMFKQCNVTAEVGSICSRDRLATFVLISCRPYLTQLNTYADSQCLLTDYLFGCVKTNLSYMQITCSEADVKDALTSGSATTWLHTHFPLVNLATCFNN